MSLLQGLKPGNAARAEAKPNAAEGGSMLRAQAVMHKTSCLSQRSSESHVPYPRARCVILQKASQHVLCCEHCFRILENVTLCAPANESCLPTEQRTSTPHDCRPRRGLKDSWVWDLLDMNPIMESLSFMGALRPNPY